MLYFLLMVLNLSYLYLFYYISKQLCIALFCVAVLLDTTDFIWKVPGVYTQLMETIYLTLVHTGRGRNISHEIPGTARLITPCCFQLYNCITFKGTVSLFWPRGPMLLFKVTRFLLKMTWFLLKMTRFLFKMTRFLVKMTSFFLKWPGFF